MAIPPNNNSSLKSEDVNRYIKELIHNSSAFRQEAPKILKAVQEEGSSGILKRIYYTIRDFFSFFSVFIDPSPKTRMIRLVEKNLLGLNEKNINDIAAGILLTPSIVMSTISIENAIQSSKSPLSKEVPKKTQSIATATLSLKESKMPSSIPITLGEKTLKKSTDDTAISQELSPILKIFNALFRVTDKKANLELDPAGFQNLGSTCFMNSGLRFLLAKSNFRELTQRSHLGEVIPKDLHQHHGEDKEHFEFRKKLLSDVIELSKAVNEEVPNRETIAHWLHEIGISPLLRERRLKVFEEQEDSHEFLNILFEAFEIEADPTMALQCRRLKKIGANFEKSGNDQALPIIELYSENQRSSNPLALISQNLAEEEIDGSIYKLSFRHSNTDRLKSLSMRLPRFDARLNKLEKKIDHIFDTFELNIFDESKNREVTLRLKARSIICHMGSTLKGGHYIAIIKEGENFYEKNDSFFRELTKEQAENQAQNQAYLVDYDVEVVGRDPVRLPDFPLDGFPNKSLGGKEDLLKGG